MTVVDSPLLQTVQLGPTAYWNDSCAVSELEYAIARGASGATSNPSIVLEVLGKEKDHWYARVRELVGAHPDWTETDVTWAIVDEMGVRGAALLAPIHAESEGRRGWLSMQTNPANYPNRARMVEHGIHYSQLAPNIQVKFPATSAGIAAMEEATAAGVNVNATVSFTVSQAIASAEAIERGLDRLGNTGERRTLAPAVTMMIGRLDDWLKATVARDGLSVDPAALDYAGIAAFKRAYAIFRERGYRSRLLVAAFRHHLHWTEVVGGDVTLTIPYAWQVRFNASGIAPTPRIEVPVEPRLVAELCERIPDFARAYEPDGLRVEEFDTYGATVRTLRSFIKAYHDLVGVIRDIMLPDPDIRRA